MKNLNIFLYICLVRFKAINLILKKFEKFKISVILDMEDSAQDLFDSQNNLKLKKISREGLKPPIKNILWFFLLFDLYFSNIGVSRKVAGLISEKTVPSTL